MRLASKDETDILINRVENLEKKIEKIEKVNKNSLKRKPIKVKKS